MSTDCDLTPVVPIDTGTLYATMYVHTATGTTYAFTEGLEWVLRLPAERSGVLRRDYEWVQCRAVDVEVGRSMYLTLSGVASAGDTLRVTSPVTKLSFVE